MSAPRIKLIHLAGHARGFGGIEALLEKHARWDRAAGFEAAQWGLFDATAEKPMGEDAAVFGFGWASTPRAMRNAFAARAAARGDSVIVWHNAWGVPWFADVDAAARRIVYLHHSEAFFSEWLPALRPWIDGVICVNPLAAEAARRLLPGFPAERVIAPAQAISPPTALTPERPERQEWVIGYAGRLVRAQKHADRLAPFVRELRRLQVPFRLEVLGAGPLEGELRRELGGVEVSFHGVVDKAEFWRRMQDWDASVFFGEAEGVPLVLVEALAAGVLPIYPGSGGSLGDVYVPQVLPACLYPAGDPAAAARALRDVRALPSEGLAGARRRAQALAATHREDKYVWEFAEFVRRIATEPRLSRPAEGGRKGRATDWLPLGLITRALPHALWR